jgi:3-oxoadipate enol-lactonase
MTPTTLYYEVSGPESAPVLVLGNSLGTTTAMWDRQVPVLSEQFRVLRFDHRGHGRSAVPPGPYTVADLGHDLVGMLDALRIDRVAYCGLSLGGMVGLWLAAQVPERVERLAVCCTSAYPGPDRAAAYADRAVQVRAHGMPSVVDRVTSIWFTPAFRAREPATVEQLAADLRATPVDGYAGCCAALAAVDLRAELAAVAAPTLVLAGADDPATPPEHGAAIAEDVRDARLVVVPDAAHLANVEAPDAVTAALVEHLSG